VERLRQAILDDNVYQISLETIAALARRVRHESVLAAFAWDSSMLSQSAA
jgi:hypothetical protein